MPKERFNCIMGGMQRFGLRHRVKSFIWLRYARRKLRERRAIAEALDQVNAVGAALNLSLQELQHTRQAIKADEKAQGRFPIGQLMLWVLVPYIIMYVTPPALEAVRQVAEYLRMDQLSEEINWALRNFKKLRPDYVLLILPVWVSWQQKIWEKRGRIRRYRLTICSVKAAEACVSAIRQGEEQWALVLWKIDRACQEVERQTLRIHRYSGSVPFRSSRRVKVRRHAAHVVGALRQQLDLIDQDPENALKDLGAGLVRIGERCAKGRIAALLPREVLEAAQPISLTRSGLRESFRIVLAIISVMVAVIITNQLWPTMGVPEEYRPWMLIGVALIAAIMVAGWSRVVRVLARLPLQ
ncbi:hypothetical protein ACFV42_29545 [Streptomyces solisilvae]|uniref:hypothetical protein n=1 Tax=Streptomyces malaysiensis TaxID=92644 RepID=UPI0036BCECE1